MDDIVLTEIKDINYKILNQLTDKELVNYCLTNKSSSQLCYNDDFWFYRILYKYPTISANILKEGKGDRTWRDYYINDIRKINETNTESYIRNGISKNRLDYIYVAMANGANISGVDLAMALVMAIERNREAMAKLFLELGADPNYSYSYTGDRPLHFAAGSGNTTIIKMLLDAGADVNVQNVYDDTPLHIAADRYRKEAIQLLLDNGADPDIEDMYGNVPDIRYLQ